MAEGSPYEAWAREGGQTVAVLVPLSTIVEFPKQHEGRTINQCIPTTDADGNVIKAGADFVEWEPWTVWHALTKRGEPRENREFDEWLDAVDFCGIRNAPDDAPDPSGGEDSQGQTSSPDSSDTPGAGPSSSTTTPTSSEPSGPTSDTPE